MTRWSPWASVREKAHPDPRIRDDPCCDESGSDATDPCAASVFVTGARAGA